MPAPVRTPTTTLPERILALLAAGLCLVVTLFLGWSVSAVQPVWPLPGLYFIEMVLLGGLAAFMFIQSGLQAKFITWAATSWKLAWKVSDPCARRMGIVAQIADTSRGNRLALRHPEGHWDDKNRLRASLQSNPKFSPKKMEPGRASKTPTRRQYMAAAQPPGLALALTYFYNICYY